MANIGEYDEIQIQKNAFYLGDLTGCLKEKDNLMLEANDYYNRNRSLLYTIRTICEKKDYAMALTILKAYVTKNNIHDPNFLTLFTEFIKYYETKKYSEAVIEGELGRLGNEEYLNNPNNLPLLTIVSYILYNTNKSEQVLHLLANTKDLDLLCIKMMIYWNMNRVDLMEETLQQMKLIEEEGASTAIAHNLLSMYKGATDQLLPEFNQIIEKFTKSTKIYILIGIVMLQKGQAEKGNKMLQKAAEEKGIKNQTLKEFIGDAEAISVVLNNILCLRASHANLDTIAEYEGMLKVIDAGNNYFKDYEEAQNLFDQALSAFK